ncbi:peritrophin-1-like [Penaeus monodon]|uniref:peritrophin-1-like n=1 Tax=Penaeus monodon TaxID=6687 RepID=UPI0018A7799F|nr:peritrophin-1-like [Penaeus monodon]
MGRLPHGPSFPSSGGLACSHSWSRHVVAENCFLSFAGSPTPNIHICHSLTCPGQDGFYAQPDLLHRLRPLRCRVPYVKRCPSNLNFNAVKGACDHPRDAPCAPFKKSCELTIPFVPGGVTDDLVTCDCEGPCIKPHPYNCDAFYHCDAAGVEHLTECPGDLMFNAMVDNVICGEHQM